MEENTGNYLDKQMDKQTFIDILISLSEQQGSFGGTYEVFAQAYDQIYIKNHTVIGRDLFSFANALKTQNNDIILQQLQYYENQIVKLQAKGYKSLKRQQFCKLIINPQNSTIIVKLITQKIQRNQLISLQKFLKLIKQKMNEFNLNKVMTIRSSINLQKSQIYVDQDQALLKIGKQYITDINALGKFQEFYQFKQKKYKILLEELNQQKRNQYRLKEQLKLIQNNYLLIQQQLNQKNQKIENLLQKTSQINEQRAATEKDNLLMSSKINQYTHRIEVLEHENELLLLKMQQKQDKIIQFIQQQQNIRVQYEQFIKQLQQQKYKKQQQQQNKIFVQRTIKQKLDDALLKISRLIQDKKNLQNKIIQLGLNYQNRINNLQQQLQQLEKKNLKNTQLKQLKLSNFYPSKIYDQGNQLKQKSSQMENSIIINSITINQPLKEVAQQLYNSHKQTFKKNIENRFSNAIIDCVQQISQITNHDFIGLDLQQNKQTKFQNISIFTSQAYIVRENGNIFDIAIAVTPQKIYILDSKFRQKQSFPLNQISKIYVCFYNQQWILLNFKSPQKKLKKINDILLSLNNRSDLLTYLSSKCNAVLKKNQFIFQIQQNIKFKSNSQFYLNQFYDVYNPFRLCFCNSKATFNVWIRQKSMLSMDYFADDCILIIQPIGMLFFQKDGLNELSKKQTLLYFLPIVQDMQMQNYGEQSHNKIRITYKYIKKRFKITTSCIAVTKKLLKEVERVRIQNINWKVYKQEQDKKIIGKK